MELKVIILLVVIAVAVCLAAAVLIFLNNPGTEETSTGTSQAEPPTPSSPPATSAKQPGKNTVNGQQNGIITGSVAGDGQDDTSSAADSSDPGNASGAGATTQTSNFGAGQNASPKPLASRCSDGTPVGQCSKTKPKLCFDTDIDLVDACHSCGCPSGSTCNSESHCQ